MAEKIKRVSMSMYPEDIEFISYFNGENNSDKLRNMIRGYKVLSDFIRKFAKDIDEKNIDLLKEDFEIEMEDKKYKLNYTHIVAFLKFKQALTEAFGKEFADDMVNKIILNTELFTV